MTRKICHTIAIYIMRTVALVSIILTCIPHETTHAGTFHFEQDRRLPMIYINFLIHGGSANDFSAEGEPKLGLAKVTATMVTRGTKTKTKDQIFQQIEALGSAIEIDTRLEGTVVRTAVLASHIKPFLNLLAEIFLDAQFPEQELKKTQGELIGQILSEKNNDTRYAMRRFQQLLFQGHPYSHPISGTEGGIARINRNDLINFYQLYYNNQNIDMIASGDVDREELLAWWNQLMGRLQTSKSSSLSKSHIDAPKLPLGKKLIFIDKPGVTQSQIVFGHNGPRPEQGGFYDLQVANEAYGGHSFNSTLMKEIREKRGWTYGISNKFRYASHPYFYMTHLFPKTSDTIPALLKTLQLFQEFKDKGVARVEFESSKKGLINSSPFNYDTPRKRLENTTTEFLYQFPKDFFSLLGRNISQSNWDNHQLVVRNFYSDRDLFVVILGNKASLEKEVRALPGFDTIEFRGYSEEK